MDVPSPPRSRLFTPSGGQGRDFWWSCRTFGAKGVRRRFQGVLPGSERHRSHPGMAALTAGMQRPHRPLWLLLPGFYPAGRSSGHVSPDCLAPAMTGLHERDHWSCEGGAHWWHLSLGWGLQLAAQQARRRGDSSAWEEIRRCLEEQRYCRDGLALLRRHDPHSMVLNWLEQDPEESSAWVCHEPADDWFRQPMLLIGGWWDPHLRGILDLHQRSLAAGGQPEMHVGPATHLNWWPEAQQLQLTFFRRHLCRDSPLIRSNPHTSGIRRHGVGSTPGDVDQH